MRSASSFPRSDIGNEKLTNSWQTSRAASCFVLTLCVHCHTLSITARFMLLLLCFFSRHALWMLLMIRLKHLHSHLHRFLFLLFSNNADHVLWSPSPGSRLPAPYGCVWWEHPEESVLLGAGEAETGPLQSGGRTSWHRECLKPRCVFVSRTERNGNIDSFSRKRKPVIVFNVCSSNAGCALLPGAQWFFFFGTDKICNVNV